MSLGRQQPARDALTGLVTGAEFERLLESLLSDRARSAPALCVCYVRLDRFHHLNRWLGFAAGDTALQVCAARILARQPIIGESNIHLAARMGGDEFAFVTSVSSPESAAEQIVGILEDLRRPIEIDLQSAYLTASAGFRLVEHSLVDARGVLHSAAVAAARARQNGGNTLVQAPDCDAPDLDARYELIQDLRQAVRRSELVLRFQPQVDRHCRLDGFEVLAGWNHPQLGAVDADAFIRLAEESGLIMELGEWVLRHTCLQLARWRVAGFICPKVAVNVSPLQFASPEFVGRVLSILEETGVPGACLEFEITENAVLRDIEESAERMRKLRAHGISFAIDDFGVGYSPLTYLHRLPVDTVKVDRSFTGEIAKNGGSLPLVHTITVLAHQRGMKVVAEGVETQGELDMVRAARCDRMQGFLFGCPLPAEGVEPLFSNTESLGPHGDRPFEERLF
jgi:diguanylate cyclase (GGDEF)-like protein